METSLFDDLDLFENPLVIPDSLNQYYNELKEERSKVAALLQSLGMKDDMTAFFSAGNQALFDKTTSGLKEYYNIKGKKQSIYKRLPPKCLRAKALALKAWCSFASSRHFIFEIPNLTELYKIICQEVRSLFHVWGADLSTIPKGELTESQNDLAVEDVMYCLVLRLLHVNDGIEHMKAQCIDFKKAQEYIDKTQEASVIVMRDFLTKTMPPDALPMIKKLERRAQGTSTTVYGDYMESGAKKTVNNK